MKRIQFGCAAASLLGLWVCSDVAGRRDHVHDLDALAPARERGREGSQIVGVSGKGGFQRVRIDARARADSEAVYYDEDGKPHYLTLLEDADAQKESASAKERADEEDPSKIITHVVSQKDHRRIKRLVLPPIRPPVTLKKIVDAFLKARTAELMQPSLEKPSPYGALEGVQPPRSLLLRRPQKSGGEVAIPYEMSPEMQEAALEGSEVAPREGAETPVSDVVDQGIAKMQQQLAELKALLA